MSNPQKTSFTDIFINKPVFAIIISLFILLLGIQAFHKLSIRQYPAIEEGIITITTAYPGANSELIQGFITSPIQQAIASSEGIDYITSTSRQNISTVVAHLQLNYSANIALTEIMSKTQAIRSQLPLNTEDPVITKGSNRGSALLYISFYSEDMSNEQVTEYLSRVIQPQLSTQPGVGEAQILGKKTFAMRIWYNPVQMAALKVDTKEINDALKESNFQAAEGQITGLYTTIVVNANTDLESVEQFNNIVVRSNGSSLIKISDVARVELEAENFDSYVSFNGRQAVYIGIDSAPSANPLTVIKHIRDIFPEIKKQLPQSLNTEIVYDATEFIQASIDEVIKTLIEATIIVILVIFLFLGNIRSVIIPVVTIPLSLTGAIFAIYLMGYSINLLTLLAMVLAIGLVVDDAIVVLENIHRQIELGAHPLKAAIEGTREIATPVISMTITLAAVFAPIGFITGLTGSLFKEFAFTLAASVVVSGIVALVLSPYMCSVLLKPNSSSSAIATKIDGFFDRLKERYNNNIDKQLEYRKPTLVFIALILISIPIMYGYIKHELAPKEDMGIIFIVSKAPQYANIDYLNTYTNSYEEIFQNFPEYSSSFLINGGSSPNTSFGGMKLTTWNKRDRSQFEIQKELQTKYLDNISGLKIFSFHRPSLPGSGGGLPIQFVINSTGDYETLYEISEKLRIEATKSGLFLFLNNDLQFNKPENQIFIDRNKAALLGITMKDIGNTLSSMLGTATLNRFSIEGKSYKVIPQADKEFRINKNWLDRYHLKLPSGNMIPLSAIISTSIQTIPSELKQFQQLNSTKLEGMLTPGVSLDDGLALLQKKANEILPANFNVDYEGSLRQYINEGNMLAITFLFALLCIYLVLSAQFESFKDPIIIMITVPMSICGAMAPLFLGNLFHFGLGISVSMNIYTQIGMITLIGLITKHGILIVEFANKLKQAENLTNNAAVAKAASLRLRPILMTTSATVLGILPLLFATGAGAVSRFNIAIIIISGMIIGTLFTLFIVPAVYTIISTEPDYSA